MFNRSINIGCLTSWSCWLAGAALAFGDMLNLTPDDSGFVGVVAVALGHLISVQGEHRQMEQREEVAFQIGRKSALRSIEKV